jgi:hypothetical protein
MPLATVLRWQGVTSALAASRRPRMKDLAFVAVTLLFFVVSWLYVRACERV